jgi:NADPH:quinone reductase-like Zn-dependent oxidoreductase
MRSGKPIGVEARQSKFEQAAAVPVAGLTALQGLLNKGRVRPGQTVLVNGASGGVGTFAVQIAKSLGAEVTGVCSTGNIDLFRSIGADHVIDYTRDDFTLRAARHDLVFDCVGDHPLSACRRATDSAGTFVAVGVRPGGRWMGPLPALGRMLLWAPFVSQKVIFFIAAITAEDLGALRELIEAGAVAPVVDRRYPLVDVPDAVAYLEAGHARGKVVITVA